MAKAMAAGVRLLAARSLTRHELVERLVKRRIDRGAAAAAADELERKGLLSDRAAAASAARSQIERGTARGLVEEKLLARGIGGATARRAVGDAATLLASGCGCARRGAIPSRSVGGSSHTSRAAGTRRMSRRARSSVPCARSCRGRGVRIVRGRRR
jgi:hypothetical protein